MPLCPQITNTPITVTQTADFTVTSVVPAVADTKDGFAVNLGEVIASSGNQTYRQLTPPTSPPFTLKVGDIWFDIDDGNKEYRWDGTNWVSVQDGSIATKNRTYYSGTAPTGSDLVTGDIWFDTNTGNKPYRWDGTTWISVQDASIATALSTANAAQTTANGKNKVIYSLSSASGTGTASGDIWWQYNASGVIIAQWEWNGSSWVSKTIGSAVIASLDAGKITAGTISVAISLEAATITGGSININSGTFVVTSTGAVTITATNGININSGTFQVSSTGAVTASNLTITGGSINVNSGVFTVSTTGAVSASNLTITGGSINVNSGVFSVSTTGNVTATSGTIGGTTLSSTALTGGTIQTSSGTTAIIMNGASNALQFKVSGSVSGNIVPLGSAGILMHYGATPDGTGGTYPKTQVTSSGAVLAGSSSYSITSSSSGNNVVGNIDLLSTMTVSGAATFNGLMYAPNLGTSTSATNLRVATGSIGEIQETTASSVRFKENIVDINTVFDLDPKKLLDLPVRAFTYKADYLSENDDRFEHMLPGFIAEEVDAIYPIAADYGQDGPHSWNERFIIPGLLALIQDLNKRIEILEGE